MKKLIKYFKEYHLSYDVIITVLGFTLLLLLIFVFIHPEYRLVRILAFLTGGLINIFNGLKIVRDSKKRTMGLSYIFFGILIALLGFFINA